MISAPVFLSREKVFTAVFVSLTPSVPRPLCFDSDGCVVWQRLMSHCLRAHITRRRIRNESHSIYLFNKRKLLMLRLLFYPHYSAIYHPKQHCTSFTVPTPDGNKRRSVAFDQSVVFFKKKKMKKLRAQRSDVRDDLFVCFLPISSTNVV